MTQYSEEKIFIRAMPCPKCGAKPREHCRRKPKEDGTIKNHQERQYAWHQFAKANSRQKNYEFSLIDSYDKFI